MSHSFSLRTVDGLAAVSKADWDGLANPGWETGARGAIRWMSDEPPFPYNPFISHDFLLICEEAGCATAETGWLPSHLLLEDEDGHLIGAAPAYLKGHSYGEYVFDHGWADAWERSGGQYYPKLQSSIPFSPVTGPRLLAADDATRQALARGMKLVADRYELSSAHVTFIDEESAAALGAEGWLERLDQQFQFRNDGYTTYDDFLGRLASRKRKALKRERREALQDGISVEWVTGSDLTEAHWDAFFAFYMDTGSRKWGTPYLNRRFFSLLSERMADRILLVMARRAGRYIAGALNLIGSDRLYGRNWGAIEEHPFLHFEVCYHQAIDYAIEHRLAVVEAGAQGEHKLSRGYLPETTRSAHYIADAGFRRVVADFLTRERRAVLSAETELESLGPFRRGPLQEQD
ncbi:GNAT family N-acetyltransferase [Pleomorphomonas sp. PLEO]|uniref:GNAT family N-acetyltransferase n=1 Tax=Pleomorphomonas sp. PLEO TaxID=3239306 RepID=UPI00351F4BA4